MNITFIGDWHGSPTQAVRAIEHARDHNSYTLLQAGDFGIWRARETEFYLDHIQKALDVADQVLYFVDGNHENFPLLYSFDIDPTTGLRPLRDNIYHLPRGWKGYFNFLDYKLSPYEGETLAPTIIALGGATSVDKASRINGQSWWPEEEVSQEDVERTLAAGTADVLLMHDCPHPAPNPVTNDPIGQARAGMFFGAEAMQKAQAHRERLTPVLHSVQPKLLVHGHYHAHGIGLYQQPNSDIITEVHSLDEGRAPLRHHTLTLDLNDTHWTERTDDGN